MDAISKYVMQMEVVGIYVEELNDLQCKVDNSKKIIKHYTEDLKQALGDNNCSLEIRESMAKKSVKAVNRLKEREIALDKVEKKYEQLKEALKAGVSGDPFMAACNCKSWLSLNDFLGIPVDNKL